jgi:hypothetical protein
MLFREPLLTYLGGASIHNSPQFSSATENRLL